VMHAYTRREIARVVMHKQRRRVFKFVCVCVIVEHVFF
jgi:hypothetical protein